MAILPYIISFLFITVSAGSSLIVYPIFLQLFFPNKETNELYKVAYLLIAYEAGRFINNLISPSLVKKLDLKCYVWTILIISTSLYAIMAFTYSFLELLLIRLLHGIFTTHNYLTIILDALLNVKAKRSLQIFNQAIPNIIFIMSFLIGMTLFSFTDYQQRITNEGGIIERSFIDNISDYNEAPHFKVIMIIIGFNLLLMMFLLLCRTISFQDSSYGSMANNELQGNIIEDNKHENESEKNEEIEMGDIESNNKEGNVYSEDENKIKENRRVLEQINTKKRINSDTNTEKEVNQGK